MIVLTFCQKGSEMASSAFAQDNDFSNKDSLLTFCVDGGKMYFYDPRSKKIYIYSTRGEFQRAYEIDKLGMRLKSISSSEIREILEKDN